MQTNNTELSSSQLRKRLFAYLAIALFSLAFFLFMATNTILFNYLKKSEDKGLVYNVQARAMAVSQWCRRAKDLAMQITSRSRIRQELVKYNTGQISLKNLTDFTTPKLKDAMQTSEEIIGIVRLDKENRIVAFCGNVKQLTAKPDFLKELASVDITKLSAPMLINKKYCLIVTAPIQYKKAQREGTDLIIISMELLYPLISSPVKSEIIDDTTLIYTDEGNNIFECFDKGKKSLIFSIPELNMKIEQARTAGYDTAIYKNHTAVISKVEGSDWFLVGISNHQKLYSPVSSKITILIIIFAIAYIISLCGFWILMNPLAGKILLRVGDLEKTVQQRTLEKEQVITELQEASHNINILRGLLPVCSHCKKIRNDEGYWEQIETYVAEHSEANFSHSICPDCLKIHYPDYYDDIMQKREQPKT